MTHATPAARHARPLPEGYHTLTPSLTVQGTAKAIEFYTRAFGARELGRMAAPDGERIWHAELQIGDSRLMLTDEFPDMGGRSPQSLGGTPVSLHLYVDDVDATVQRALDNGAKLVQPVMEVFWGDRYGRIDDPFGHHWGIATHVEDVPEDEMQRRAEAFTGANSG